MNAILLIALLFAGRPLADALHDLEAQGLQIIYSDEVVKPSMIVKEEPRAKEPRAILDEILAPHHLRATAGPRGTILIVRVEEPQATPKSAMPVALEQIVVTPSRFEILASEPETRQFMSRDEVRRVPHLSDDLFRAIQRVPGTAQSDVTARPNIRGGNDDEVSVLVDGAEIYDPFHLKDLYRAFSTIDAEAVGGVSILTGGFPSEYGGRMSGVIDVDTLAPSAVRTEVGISLLNTRVLSQGTFRTGKGEWLVSLRRGYLREMLQLVDENSAIDPRYYDLLGKLQWTLGDSAIVSAHVLASNDKLNISEDSEKAKAIYRDQYFWLSIRGAPTPRLFGQSIASIGTLKTERSGSYGPAEFYEESGNSTSDRHSRIVSLKNDASFDLSLRNVIKAGLTLRNVSARYRFDGRSLIRFTPAIPGGPPNEIARHADIDVSGNEYAVYAADRLLITPRLVGEIGVRVESESYTPDGVNVSPRLNFVYGAGDRTTIRVAWGSFAQPQNVYELQVEDGVNNFYPAQHAEHRVLGIDHAFAHGLTARLELYDKEFTDVLPRYENIFNRLVIFPELRRDRLRIAPERSTARGAELLLRTNPAAEWSGWFSYVRADVTDSLDGRNVPRSWDQRHAFTACVNYRRGSEWNFNLAGTYHSGWPTTPVTAHLENGHIVAEAGGLNSARLPDYRRFDFRASRNVAAKRGVVNLFVEFYNVFNQANVLRLNGFNVEDGEVTARYQAPFGIIPSFGVTFQF